MAEKKQTTYKGEEVDRLLSVAEALKDIEKDLPDFSNTFKEIRDFGKEVLTGLKQAGRLFDVVKETGVHIKNMTNALDMFNTRSLSARSAIEELNSGFSIATKRQKFLNDEAQRFEDIQRVGAGDIATRVDITNALANDLKTSNDKLLDTKRAILSVDATILDNINEWGERTMTFTQLQKQAHTSAEQLKMSQTRLDILNQFLAKEKEIAEIRKRGNGFGLTRDEKNEIIDRLNSDIDTLKRKYKKTGGGVSISNKGSVAIASQKRGLERVVGDYTRDQLRATYMLAKAETENNTQSIIGLKLRGRYMSHAQEQNYKMLGSLGGIVNKTIAWRKEISLIPVRFTILNFLISAALDRFQALDKAAEKFRTETGFTIDQMAHVRKQVERVNVEFADMGVSIEKAYDSAKALTEEFQMTSLVTGEAVKNVALMSANLGVLEKDSASVLSTFQGLGGATEKAAFNVMKVGAGISGKVGVPFSLVMKDIANASENTLSMLSANPTVLMRSAIAARTLGTDLNKITQSQRKLLDFSTSITDELELSALLGTSISFQKSRQLAYDGRIEDAAKATLETVKAAGDFDKMSVYQREQLAKAAGMELKDLSKMLSVDRRRKEIENGSDQAAKDRLKAQDEALKQLNEKNDLSKQSLADEYESEIRQQKMQGIITNLKKTIDAIAISMADILEPIITPLAKILVPTLKAVGVLFRLLGGAIKWFLDPIVSVANWIGKWADGLKVVASKVSFVKDETKELGYYFGDVLDILASIGKIAVSVVAGGYMMGMFFGTLGFPKVMELLKKPFTSVVGWGKAALSKMSGGRLFGGGAAPIPTPSAPPGATRVKPGAGSGMRDFLKNVGAGLKSMAGSKVAQGALNLLLASPGLIAIIPGALLAGLIPKKSGDNIEKFLTGLADGLKKMGTGKVTGGSANTVLASVGLLAMMPGALLAGLIPKNSGGNIEKFLTGLAGGLKQMGTGKVTGGSANMILASIGLVAMIPGAIAATILGVIGKPIELGLKYLAKGIGYMASNTVLRGALGIAAVGVSIIPFAAAMNMFGGVDWVSVGIGALALVGFTAAAFGLGLLFSTGAGAIIFTAGVIGIAALGLALIPFGVAALAAGAGIKMFGDGVSTSVDPIIKLSAIDLTKTALGIGALGIALAAFGAGSAYAGLTSFVGGLLGGDPIAKMEKLAGIGAKLKISADSITAISIAASQFSSINSFADSIVRLADSLGNLNGQLSSMNTENLAKLQAIGVSGGETQPSTETQPTTTAPDLTAIVNKLDEIYKGLTGGEVCVYLDGSRVSGKMSNRA